VTSIVASTPLRALVIEERAFRPLVDRHPSIQGKLLRTLAERIAPQHL
jgi:CRP-like cAMP-binding protein